MNWPSTWGRKWYMWKVAMHEVIRIKQSNSDYLWLFRSLRPLKILECNASPSSPMTWQGPQFGRFDSTLLTLLSKVRNIWERTGEMCSRKSVIKGPRKRTKATQDLERAIWKENWEMTGMIDFWGAKEASRKLICVWLCIHAHFMP